MKDNTEGAPTQVETGIRLPIVGRYHAQCKTGAWPFWTQCEYSVDMYSCVLLFLHSLFFFIHCLCCFSLNYSHSPTMTPRGNHCTVYTSLCLFCFICFAISALMDRIEQLFEIVLFSAQACFCHQHFTAFQAKNLIIINVELLC